MSIDFTDYRDIFLNDRPMMDTRAPVEFLKGSFPGVVRSVGALSQHCPR